MELLSPELINGEGLQSIPEQTEVLDPPQPFRQRTKSNEESTKQLQREEKTRADLKFI